MRALPVSGVAGVLGLTLSFVLAEASRSEPLWQMASLVIGNKAELASVSDEIEPRAQLKHPAGPFPEVNATMKGDPYIGLRPSLEGRLRGR